MTKMEREDRIIKAAIKKEVKDNGHKSDDLICRKASYETGCGFSHAVAIFQELYY